RMRRIGEVMQQDLNSGVRKGFADEAHNALVVLKKFMCVIGNLLTVIFLEYLSVNLLLGGLELRSHIVLLADEDELSLGGMNFVFKEVMHSQPEILQAEFAEVFT